MLFINHARYTWILWSISGSLPRLVPSPWTMPVAISPHPPAFINLSASCAPWRSCHLSLCTSIGSSSSMSSSSGGWWGFNEIQPMAWQLHFFSQRLVTCFFYLGTFSLPYCWNTWVLVRDGKVGEIFGCSAYLWLKVAECCRGSWCFGADLPCEVHYCSSLEEVAFQRKSAEYLWMLVCGAGAVQGVTLLTWLMFLSEQHAATHLCSWEVWFCCSPTCLGASAPWRSSDRKKRRCTECLMATTQCIRYPWKLLDTSCNMLINEPVPG